MVECCCKLSPRTKKCCTRCRQLLMVPGLTILDISTDAVNSYELAGGDTSWMGPFGNVHSFNTSLCYYNDSMQATACRPQSDPIWATVSGILIFAPGWLLAIYFWLGSRSGGDYTLEEKKETWRLILLSVFLFPFMLVFTQVANILGYYEDFTAVYCNVFEGVEAFGESAPQLLLNGFVILHRGKITTFQGISMSISLVTLTRRVLTFDFIPENRKDYVNALLKNENAVPKTKFGQLLEHLEIPGCCCAKDSTQHEVSRDIQDEVSRDIQDEVSSITNTNWFQELSKLIGRLILINVIYILSLFLRLYGLLLIAVFQRWLSIATIFIHLITTVSMARYYDADAAGCFLLSVINILIQSNGGVDDIKASSYVIMRNTSIICFLNYGMWLLVTMLMISFGCDFGRVSFFYIPFMHHLLQSNQETCYVCFGDLGRALPMFCWLFYMGIAIFHLLLLKASKKYLPQTQHEYDEAEAEYVRNVLTRGYIGAEDEVILRREISKINGN